MGWGRLEIYQCDIDHEIIFYLGGPPLKGNCCPLCAEKNRRKELENSLKELKQACFIGLEEIKKVEKLRMFKDFNR